MFQKILPKESPSERKLAKIKLQNAANSLMSRICFKNISVNLDCSLNLGDEGDYDDSSDLVHFVQMKTT